MAVRRAVMLAVSLLSVFTCTGCSDVVAIPTAGNTASTGGSSTTNGTTGGAGSTTSTGSGSASTPTAPTAPDPPTPTSPTPPAPISPPSSPTSPISPTLPTATASATITDVSPIVLQAGSDATVITLSASGIGSGAMVVVDGANHAATVASSTVATVMLSAGELAVGGRHNIAIQNLGMPTSNTETLLVTDGYWAFGDSITHGVGFVGAETANYAYLLAAAYHLTFVNNARSGDQACDVWSQMYDTGAGYTRQAAPLFSLMIGTNDVDNRGTGAYEAVFTACDLSALSWLGTPRTAKVLAGDATFATSGTCGITAQASLLGCDWLLRRSWNCHSDAHH